MGPWSALGANIAVRKWEAWTIKKEGTPRMSRLDLELLILVILIVVIVLLTRRL